MIEKRTRSKKKWRNNDTSDNLDSEEKLDLFFLNKIYFHFIKNNWLIKKEEKKEVMWKKMEEKLGKKYWIREKKSKERMEGRRG